MKIHSMPQFQLVFCDAGDNLFPAGYLETSFYPLDLLSSPYDVLTQAIAAQKNSTSQTRVQKVYTQQLSLEQESMQWESVTFSLEQDSMQRESPQQDSELQVSMQQAQLKSVIILKQTHSTQGFCVTTENVAELTTAPRREGDFLCTQLSGVGIGVLTADCLPIAFYDPLHHAAAIVHAGWRGMVDGVGAQTLQSMRDSFGTRPEDVQVFFGPCAKSCCYQVGEDFLQHLASFSWADKVVDRRENGLFFNLPLCNSLLLQDAGVNPASISYEYNSCTICNNSFCSYRRDAAASCRQLALIVLS